MDEVGRGCLAGPVVAAAVVLDPDRYIPRICDSKTVTALERERLYDADHARGRRLGAWPAPIRDEIDPINIHQASLRAMQRAVLALAPLPDFVLVDAFRIPDLPMAQRGVIHGDRRCTAIAAASIVAKVTRDRLMLRAARDAIRATGSTATRATPRAIISTRWRGSATPTCTAARSGRRRCLIGWTGRPPRIARPWRTVLALDREDTLKKAEKLLRQGRLDAAIAEYLRVVEDQPRDWNTANTLGDLYVRAGQPDKAVAQYTRIADHFVQEGFYPKAAALYKKILKIKPDEEARSCSWRTSRRGRACWRTPRRTSGRSPRAGGRAATARAPTRSSSGSAPSIRRTSRRGSPPRACSQERRGDVGGASARFRELHADLLEKGREAEALAGAARSGSAQPRRPEGAPLLARAASRAGPRSRARSYLDRETAGDDPALLMALAEIELRAGELDRARELLAQLLTRDLACATTSSSWRGRSLVRAPEAAFVCIDAAVDASIAAAEFERRRRDAAGVRRRACRAHPRAAEARRSLRRRRARNDDVRDPGAAGRRVPGGRRRPPRRA